MLKPKGQYVIIALLFLATNVLYYFAQRDTLQLSHKSPEPAGTVYQATTDSLVHHPAGSH